MVNKNWQGFQQNIWCLVVWPQRNGNMAEPGVFTNQRGKKCIFSSIADYWLPIQVLPKIWCLIHHISCIMFGLLNPKSSHTHSPCWIFTTMFVTHTCCCLNRIVHISWGFIPIVYSETSSKRLAPVHLWVNHSPHRRDSYSCFFRGQFVYFPSKFP